MSSNPIQDAKMRAAQLLEQLKPRRSELAIYLRGANDQLGKQCALIVENLWQVEDEMAKASTVFKIPSQASPSKGEAFTDATPCPVGKTPDKNGTVWFGVPLGDVDEGYLKWFFKQDWCKTRYPQLYEYIERSIISVEHDLDENEGDLFA